MNEWYNKWYSSSPLRRLVPKRTARVESIEQVKQNIIADAAISSEPVAPQLPTVPIPVYKDFDLRLSLDNGNMIKAEVLRSPGGEAQCDGIVTPPTYDINDVQRKAASRHLRPLPDEEGLDDAGSGSLPPIDLSAHANEIGQAMFAGRCGDVFRASLILAQNDDSGLRIRLRTEHEVTAAIPWELACVDEECLSLRKKTPLVRYVEMDQPAGSVTAPEMIRVLGIVSDPKDRASLDSAKEKAELKKTMSRLIDEGLVQLEWLPDARLDYLQNALRHGFHVVHFIGHGAYDASAKSGQLLFKNREGNSQALAASNFATLLQDSTVRFAFLNACETAHAAGGLAEALVRKGLPAALGMRTTVFDRVAIIFAGGFYAALNDGYPVDAAMVEGRRAVLLRLGAEVDDPYAHPHWVHPVLYMRAPDGHLFKEVER